MSRFTIQGETQFIYQGGELELFTQAINWKRYFSSKLRPFVRGYVIEVGAGMGNSTKYLHRDAVQRWVCVDPDPGLASRLARRIAEGDLPRTCEVRCGVLADLASEELADTVIYIDVLEHIKRDEDEMRVATAHLKPGGRIIVLSPAFNWLYSAFDAAIGHYRRYATRDARRLTVTQLALERIVFLDSIGLFASLWNRLFLRAPALSQREILLWDRAIIPVSVYADRLFGSLFGRTIVMIWQKK